MDYVYGVSDSCGALFSSFRKAEERVKEMIKDLELEVVRIERNKNDTYYRCRTKEIGEPEREIHISKQLVY